MKNLALVFLALAVGFGTFGFYQQQQVTALRARVAELEKTAATAQEQSATNAGQLEKLKEQAGSQKAVIDQLEARNKELAKNPPPPAAAKEGGEAGKGGGDFMKGFAKMFNDPKMRDAMRAQQSAQVNLMYSGLAKELGLAPDVAKQVLAILGDRQADIAAKGMAAMDRDGKGMEAMGKETQEVRKAYDEQLKAILGEENFKKLGDYDQSIGDRVALDQMQRQLSASGMTLEAGQQKGLLDIMKEERKRANVPSATTNDQAEAQKLIQDDASVDKWLTSQQDMNRRVLDRARGVLSADQLVAFEAAQKQFLDMQKMGVQMSKEFFKKK